MNKTFMGVLTVLLVVSVGFNIWQAQSGSGTGATGKRVVAKVGNLTLTEAKMNKLGKDIVQKQKAVFRSQSRVVDNWVNKQVIELEAKAQGKKPEQFLTDLQTQQKVTVSEEEVAAVVKQFGAVYPDPKNPDKRTLIPNDEARKYLVQVKQQQALRDYFVTLQKKYPVKTFLVEPSAPTIDKDLALTTRPSFGNPNAKVKLIEFSDFQCPFCARFAQNTLSRIKDEYSDKIFYVFRDLPIASHQYAYDAAWAAKCANKQGKFWDYHDILFENQKQLNRDSLIKYAKKVGMDDSAFQTCLNDKSISKMVEEDVTQAQELNINGTPTMVLQVSTNNKIKGEVIEGAVSYQVLKQKIDEALSKTN